MDLESYKMILLLCSIQLIYRIDSILKSFITVPPYYGHAVASLFQVENGQDIPSGTPLHGYVPQIVECTSRERTHCTWRRPPSRAWGQPFDVDADEKDGGVLPNTRPSDLEYGILVDPIGIENSRVGPESCCDIVALPFPRLEYHCR